MLPWNVVVISHFDISTKCSFETTLLSGLLVARGAHAFVADHVYILNKVQTLDFLALDK